MEEKNNEEIRTEVVAEVEQPKEEQEVVKEAQPVNTQNINNQTNNNTQSNTRNLAVASLICSLVGLLIFRLPLGIVALITGIIAYNKEDVETTNSKGMAIAGIVIGILHIVTSVIIAFIAFLLNF